jgi:hypothetical protein
MSSNTNTSRYKQVNRQARIQTREGAFSKGMMYTNKPLADGYTKLLVNYDIDPLDGTVRTRKGLQTTAVYPIFAMATNARLFGMNNGYTNIVDSSTRASKDFQRNTSNNSEMTTDLVVYNTSTNALNVVAIAGLTEEDKERTESNVTETKAYPSKAPYSMQPLCSGTEDAYQVTPRTILEPGIHGQKCIHDLCFRKPVGTFAFGNSYYTFSKHTLKSGEVKDELHYTQYYNDATKPSLDYTVHTNEPTKYSNGSLYDYQVVPQTLNPAEAASAGFNMLAEDPYAFECEEGSNIEILGVLPYVNEQILLQPNINQDFTFKCYYRAPISTGQHQLIVHAVSSSILLVESDFNEDASPLSRIFTLNPTTGTIQLGARVPKLGALAVGDIVYESVTLGDSTGQHAALYRYEILNVDRTVGSEKACLTKRTTYYIEPRKDTLYRVKWEWREMGATVWAPIKEEYFNFSQLNKAPLTCDFCSAVEQLIVRVTITNPDNIVQQVDGSRIEYVESTSSFGLRFVLNNTETNTGALVVNYNLATAKGMLEWKNRLVLWGVENAETVLFTSEVNNPTYFPYPNNIDILDEPIIHCMLYGDDLIVFTNTKLYRLTIGETGGIGAHTLIQKNLNIVEKDLPMFCLVKNMLFFKSGNYYYMLVPKSSSITGETTIAPVSNTIYSFLDNFNNEVEKLFNIYTQGRTKYDPTHNYAWEYPFSSYLEYYYAYTDNEKVVLNFMYDYSGFLKGHPDFDETSSALIPGYNEATHSWDTIDFTDEYNQDYCRPRDKRQFILSLIYDTTTYAWSIHIYETPGVPCPIYRNALGQQHYMYVALQVAQGYDKSPVFVQCTKQNTEDNLVLYQDALMNNLYDYTCADKMASMTSSIPIQKNYQYLDTGYRVLTSSVDIKKRFREVQFSINNVSQKALTFYTAFIVDGNLRKDMKGYVTKMVTDPEDPRTGVLLVERPYIDERYLPSVPDYVIKVEDYVSPDITPGDTTLDDTFVLDNTQFPDLAYWKVRVDVSGKGYTPRLQILSVNDKDYSVLSTNWVYRTMNSR